MAEILTARDKFPQVEAQLKSAEMERYVLGIRVLFDPGVLPESADDFEKTAHAALKGEADGSRAGIKVWDKKLSVLRSIYDELKTQVDTKPATP